MNQQTSNAENEIAKSDVAHAFEAAATVRNLAHCAIRFASIERVPRYSACRRENDAEHSFMLGLVSSEVSYQYYPDLNDGLVTQFANVHDLVELETDDEATFILDDTALAAKARREHAALPGLARRLPPRTAELLQRYERQSEPEARLVRLIDKVLPVTVNSLGTGRQVMAEDYDIHSVDQLAAAENAVSERLRNWFPEPEMAFLHLVRQVLVDQFSEQFTSVP